MSDSNKAVFLSYASQDAEAAKRICEALRGAGVEVWFDQSELVGGDAWDQKIRKQIKDCALLIPIISAATQARREGYFRLEWRLADQRTHLMAKGLPFLLPVVIDDTRDADAHVPDSFTEVQWTRLPGGEGAGAFAERAKKLLGGDVRAPLDGARSEANHGRRQATPLHKPKPVWLWAVLAVLALGAAYFIFKPRRSPEEVAKLLSQAQTIAANATKATVDAPQTEAQKLVTQARQIYESGDELNRENLFFAEDLVKRAQSLDPAEPTAWELGAELSYEMVWFSIDNSAQRRESMMQQANRALALAPQSVPAQLAVINARLAINFNSMAAAAEFEQEVLALAAREPRNWQVQRALGTTYRFLNRPDESLTALRRSLELSNGNPGAAADLVNVLLRRRLYAEAEETVAANLPGHRAARLLAWDVLLKLRWRGDTAAAQKSQANFPAWLLQEDRGLFLVWQTWMWSREPQQALRAVLGTQRDYVRDFHFYGPRAALTALANEMAGNAEAARADWQIVLARVDRELAGEPESEPALYWKAWALARLGQAAEARPIATRLQQRNRNGLPAFFKGTDLAPLLVTLGQTDAALAEIKARLGGFDDSLGFTRAMLELDPVYEPLRSDPRFRELLELAPAPTNSAAIAPKVDDKSVAVLAFTNLSDDKANEYFSDGISEELLNVLAKIPGLKVSARTSAFYFKGKEVPVPEIARQLGVAYVVEGSVRKQGDKVRITAQLIKAADGFHVWSDTFTRELKDIFAIQDEIAGLIAQTLELKIGLDQPGRREINPEAFRLLLSGRAKVRQSGNANRDSGIADFRAAVALSPDYAEAWAEMAHAYIQNARFGGVALETGFREARAAAQKALALAPDSAEVLANVGWVRRTADWDWRGADQAFHRAVQLSPDNADILTEASVTLLNVGHIDEAIQLGRRAVTLDPLNPDAHFNLSFILGNAGHLQEAVESARRAMALAPGAEDYHSNLAAALADTGQLDEAERELALETHGDTRITAEALILVRRGQKAEARAKIRELEGLPNRTNDMVELYAENGDIDLAFAALEKSYALHETGMAWAKVDYYLKNLRSDPRWPVFLHKMGLADDQLK
jgi:TolB-like protein/Tfp pilus assembly protein PilF